MNWKLLGKAVLGVFVATFCALLALAAVGATIWAWASFCESHFGLNVGMLVSLSPVVVLMLAGLVVIAYAVLEEDQEAANGTE